MKTNKIRETLSAAGDARSAGSAKRKFTADDENIVGSEALPCSVKTIESDGEALAEECAAELEVADGLREAVAELAGIGRQWPVSAADVRCMDLVDLVRLDPANALDRVAEPITVQLATIAVATAATQRANAHRGRLSELLQRLLSHGFGCPVDADAVRHIGKVGLSSVLEESRPTPA